MRTVGLRVPVSLFAALLLAGVLPGCGGSSSSSPATTAVTAAIVDSDMARLGIVGEDVDENFRVVAKSLGRKVPERGVAVIRFVDDPPAKAAGLVDSSAHQNAVQDSDIIETMDGEPVTAEQLKNVLEGRTPGETVTLHVWSADGTERDVEVELDAVPQAAPGTGGYFPGG